MSWILVTTLLISGIPGAPPNVTIPPPITSNTEQACREMLGKMVTDRDVVTKTGSYHVRVTGFCQRDGDPEAPAVVRVPPQVVPALPPPQDDDDEIDGPPPVRVPPGEYPVDGAPVPGPLDYLTRNRRY